MLFRVVPRGGALGSLMSSGGGGGAGWCFIEGSSYRSSFGGGPRSSRHSRRSSVGRRDRWYGTVLSESGGDGAVCTGPHPSVVVAAGASPQPSSALVVVGNSLLVSLLVEVQPSVVSIVVVVECGADIFLSCGANWVVLVFGGIWCGIGELLPESFRSCWWDTTCGRGRGNRST